MVIRNSKPILKNISKLETLLKELSSNNTNSNKDEILEILNLLRDKSYNEY